MPSEIERLYREHRAGLVRLVERELRDHHDAEDVVQTAFLDAQRALERGTIPRNPRAWLAAIALNAGRRLRRRRLSAEPLEEYAVQEASGIPEINAALESLPREQRAAVVYRDVLGLSYGETAEQMGTSVNAVTMLLHRGRRRLRQTLAVTTVGIGLWRWGKRLGMPQAAVAKGAATVVVAAGLATTGIVAARAVAPVDTKKAAAAMVTRARAPRTVLALDSARHHRRTAKGPKAAAAHAATRRSNEAATSAPALSSTAEVTTSASRTTLQVPTVHLPALTIPTTPTTVAVSTPVTTVTVTVPTVTTATVTTPITTVTVPIP
ncbi:MAG TPA: sigma-70 family RNA polymerase sigma factor [Gaiellaceae bacterium]